MLMGLSASIDPDSMLATSVLVSVMTRHTIRFTFGFSRVQLGSASATIELPFCQETIWYGPLVMVALGSLPKASLSRPPGLSWYARSRRWRGQGPYWMIPVFA